MSVVAVAVFVIGTVRGQGGSDNTWKLGSVSKCKILAMHVNIIAPEYNDVLTAFSSYSILTLHIQRNWTIIRTREGAEAGLRGVR